MFSHLRITGKMLFVLGIFVTFLLGIGLLANSTIEEVKVTGPIYKDIVLGKDLVADILPPPEYIIESYLTAFEVAGITNQAKIHERLSRLAELRKDYDTRHAYWETNLKDPAIRKALLDDAHASAMAFYSCLQGKFVPAIQKSDHTEAMNLLYGELRDYYEKHRSAIDHVVSLANASVDATEAKAKITLQERIWWLLAGLGGMLLLTVSLLIVLSRSFTVPLNKAVAFAKSIRAGDFSSDVEVRGKDEIAELGRALKAIPEILEDVCSTVEDQVRAVERGELANRADVSPFPGEFGKLVAGGNALADMYMGIINLVPTPFTIISPDFGVRFINRVGLQVGGLSFAEATTKKCRDIFHAEDCGKNCACQRVLHSGQSETAQTHCRPNGQEMEINYTGAPLTDREGKVIGVMEIVTDLTALKATQRRIENTARKATDIAERLANAAEELSAQVEHVTEGSRVQRQLMEETSTAMEQMNASVIDVARNSSEAAKGVDGSKGQAVSGAAVVGKVVSAMSQVDTQARDLKTHMQGLGNQAEAIGQVMNVISDIADQTNLLALNAAIEAARAGEAGRGFAVVADEVRKLAEKTMAATREVGETIRAIQDAARTSIDSAEAASQTISQATRLAGESGEVLQQIVATAEQNAGQVQGIAAAAEEQSATSEQINSAVAEVSKIVHETAEGMAQSNEAVREVSRMSADLSELMRQMS